MNHQMCTLKQKEHEGLCSSARELLCQSAVLKAASHSRGLNTKFLNKHSAPASNTPPAFRYYVLTRLHKTSFYQEKR
eukprot:1156561-Pelagomonas_calceolata.AAC.9